MLAYEVRAYRGVRYNARKVLHNVHLDWKCRVCDELCRRGVVHRFVVQEVGQGGASQTASRAIVLRRLHA